MQLKRMVCDVDAVDGVLLPAEHWRMEVASGETGVHRRFVALQQASDKAIARFASRFGLLRIAAAEAVQGHPEPYWQEQAHRMGVDREDDIERALAWVRNPKLPYPADADDILKLAERFAQSIPEADLRAMAALVSDRPWDEVEPLLDAAQQAGDVPALPLGDLLEPVGLDVVRPAPLARLRAALEVAQAFGHALARDATVRDRPRSPSFGRTLASLVSAVPMPVDVLNSPERTEEWRALAALIGEWAELTDLLHRATAEGLEGVAPRRLTQLLADRVDWTPPPRHHPAEVADLAIPVVRSRIEQALAYAGAWPPSSAGPTPLYARIVLRLWRDLTEEHWPKRCAEPGCISALPGHRKNILCPTHAAGRQRRRVARRRAAQEALSRASPPDPRRG